MRQQRLRYGGWKGFYEASNRHLGSACSVNDLPRPEPIKSRIKLSSDDTRLALPRFKSNADVAFRRR